MPYEEHLVILLVFGEYECSYYYYQCASMWKNPKSVQPCAYLYKMKKKKNLQDCFLK